VLICGGILGRLWSAGRQEGGNNYSELFWLCRGARESKSLSLRSSKIVIGIVFDSGPKS